MVTIDIKSAQQTLQKKVVLSHTYVLEKYCKNKLTLSIYSSTTFITTMPIWGNTGVLGQNCRGKVNRSKPIYYEIDMDLHYV